MHKICSKTSIFAKVVDFDHFTKSNFLKNVISNKIDDFDQN